MNYDKLKIKKRKSIYLAFVREIRPAKCTKRKWWLVMVANSQEQMEERLDEIRVNTCKPPADKSLSPT